MWMKYTNVTNAHPGWLAALEADDYDGPDVTADRIISVTRLISPVQMVTLQRIHASELAMDVAEAAFMVMGTAVHALLEKAAQSGRLAGFVERRYQARSANWYVTGKIDHFDPATGILTDYKTCGAFAIRMPKEEWEAQLNVLAWLLRQNGHTVNKVQVSAFIRDHMKSKVGKEKGYPANPIPTIDIPLWDGTRVSQFIVDRLHAFEAAWYDGVLGFCSKEETWSGRRCKDWCAVARFCPQIA